MAIPDFQSVMLPLLRLAGDGEEHRFSEAVERLANEFELSAEERAQLIKSGGARLFTNRVGWSRTYLKAAGLLDATRWGHFRISKLGAETLKKAPERITLSFLNQFPGIRELRSGRTEAKEASGPPAGVVAEPPVDRDETPEEELGRAFEELNQSLEQELLDRLRATSPAYFEQVVVDALVAAGYGGTQSDAGRALGRSGDGGVDGVIREDRLGLDLIYLQAKRWEGTVGRPKIQEFVGALQGRRAKKGVFITTSDFSREAREYADAVDVRIVLLDGHQLAKLMIEHGVGVTTRTTLVVRKIDNDYFDEAN